MKRLMNLSSLPYFSNLYLMFIIFMKEKYAFPRDFPFDRCSPESPGCIMLRH